MRVLPMRGRGLIARGSAAAVLAVAAFAAYHAALGGYFVLDDFGMLAIVRFLDTPLVPFYTDHIGGSLFYRPLGMALWWLSEAAFGADARWHYALNLALHVAVAAALWYAVRAFGGGARLGWIVALAFVVHPIGIGTSLWLADRFDLLAALFGLLGLASACRYERERTARSGALCLVWLAFALLSKEIGLVYLAAAFVLAVAPSPARTLRERLGDGAALAALGVLFLSVRAWVLADPAASGLVNAQSIVDLALRGMAAWLRGWVDFAGYRPALPEGLWRWACGLGWVALGLAILVSAATSWSGPRLRLLLAGAVVWAVPAALQWPLTGHSDPSIAEGADALKLTVDARYYYTAAIGFALAVAAGLHGGGRHQRAARRLAGAAVLMLMAVWIPASQRLAERYREMTAQQRSITESAVAAIDRLDLDRPRCQVYLLDTGNWMFTWVADEVVKAIHPDFARVARCLFQSEHTPWYHLVPRGGADPSTVWPMWPLAATDLRRDVRPSPLGRGEIVYLNLSPALDAAIARHAYFLSYRQGRFVDVTAEVLERRRTVAFACNRPPMQCP